MPEEWGGHDNGRIPLDALRQLEHATYNGKPTTAFRLRTDAALSLDRLLLMAKADGYNTDITDAYRDYATQVALKASKGVYAATPGTSNHGWAMASDLAYHAGPTSFGRWMWANEDMALEHGWYPPAWTHYGRGIEEPWHWEYDHTQDRHRNEPAVGGLEETMFCAQGDGGRVVKFWQRVLRNLGQNVKVDGDYGAGTAKAVAAVTGTKGDEINDYQALVLLLRLFGKGGKSLTLAEIAKALTD